MVEPHRLGDIPVCPFCGHAKGHHSNCEFINSLETKEPDKITLTEFLEKREK